MLVLAVSGCQRNAPDSVPPRPHYVIGKGWRGQDAWFYPAERFSLRQTGLAVVERGAHAHVTADGEIWAPTAMTGAHQTLQLPAIVLLRNMANGRIVRIRLNDRGPVSAGRLVSVTPQVGALLGMAGSEPAPVELTVDEAASRAIAEASPEAPHLEIQAAPRGDVTAESLDTGGSARGLVGRHEEISQRPHGELILAPLPVQFSQGYAQPVSYAILLGSFSGHAAAAQVAARCAAEVVPARDAESSGLNWEVRMSSLQSVAQADGGLARARECGIAGARIVLE